jgi:hypothetical protein
MWLKASTTARRGCLEICWLWDFGSKFHTFPKIKNKKCLKSLILKFVAISSPDLRDSLGLEIARCYPSRNQTIDKDIWVVLKTINSPSCNWWQPFLAQSCYGRSPIALLKENITLKKENTWSCLQQQSVREWPTKRKLECSSTRFRRNTQKGV